MDLLVYCCVGDPVTFNISVTPRRNLPLDLYILIDLSFSMTDELVAIQNIANRIGVLTLHLLDGLYITFPWIYIYSAYIIICRRPDN